MADAEWKPKVNPWVIASVVAMAAFMEVLDTSIANVAIPYIAGELKLACDLNDETREIENVSDLTMGEYIRLLENPPN